MAESLDEVKTRILSRINLATLISETVRLETRSGRPMGLCPFHSEKSPSFAVYDDHYHCFGCKKTGDAIDFVRGLQGLGYVDALRHLAGKYGIEAPELEEGGLRRSGRRREAALYQMMAAAQDFYAGLRQTPAGKSADDYLLGRGFTAASIADFGFGLTPPEGFGLIRHLRALGYAEDDMVACSLATVSARDGRPFDFLRGRLTLPIRDVSGRVIGFGGRTLTDAQPKYLNSRESRLFDKAHTLFGLDRARLAMRQRGRAVIVEGYMDTLQLWQAGMPEAVACLGTAFTAHQLRLLRHATGQVVLLFDGDRAGQKATLAAVKVALSVPDIEVKAAVLSGGEDPDSFVRRHGLSALEDVIARSSGLLDFAIRERLRGTAALAIPDLVAREFVPWLAQVPERLQRSFLLTRMAHLTGIEAATIASQLHDEVQRVAGAETGLASPGRQALAGGPSYAPRSGAMGTRGQGDLSSKSVAAQARRSADDQRPRSADDQRPRSGSERMQTALAATAKQATGALQRPVAGSKSAADLGPEASPRPEAVPSDVSDGQDPTLNAPLPPLSRACFDLLGHVFHAQPGEFDVAALGREVRAALDLAGEHLALFEELCQSLATDKAPAALPRAHWVSALHPDIEALLDRLTAAKGAFVCASRRDKLAELFSHVRQQQARATVARLKAEMTRAAADPARRAEVVALLKSIQELSRSSPRPTPT